MVAAVHHAHRLQSDGLWLLALGALLVVAALVAAGPPRGLDGTRMAEGRPNERIAWSLNVAGASSIVAGSILLLIGNFPTDWVLWVSVVTLIAILVVGSFISGRKFARKLPGWR